MEKPKSLSPPAKAGNFGCTSQVTRAFAREGANLAIIDFDRNQGLKVAELHPKTIPVIIS
jgi:hypothetical protein